MPVLSDEQIAKAMHGLPGWARDDETLAATFRRKDWRDALEFVNAIGEEAERRNHHPDVCISGYRTVTVRLTTHSEGGITQRDTALAEWISEVAAS
jgi:4a-hydroxytetrahydrobiopterin dehydratase